MTMVDSRGCAVSGATADALVAYEHAVDRLLSWRDDVEAPLATALRAASRFTMAHVLQAYLCVCSRDQARVRSAARLLRRAGRLAADRREAAHLRTARFMLAGDYAGAKAELGALLAAVPRDALALHVAHLLDHWTGDVAALHGRVAAVLPEWSGGDRGYHAVLAMHAFGLVEGGQPHHGEEVARAALALEPSDARAHHAMAHAFEASDRAEIGLRWMHAHAFGWERATPVATHCWWHIALFHLSLGDVNGALNLYDQRVRAERSNGMADLIDAASLLWRIDLHGGDTGPRWSELAQAWAPHILDRHSSFSDIHAMLAFVGAHDWGLAEQLESALKAARTTRTRYGETTRQLGLRACRGLLAYGRENLALSIGLLGSLPARLHRLGGSQAQRDVLHLTLMRAVQRIRRPAGATFTGRLTAMKAVS